ncbi:MAG: zeta toxin family protein [Bacteroidia bacterium]|jgi:uridine kinase
MKDQNPHEQAASVIIPQIVDLIKAKKEKRYTITLSGESGCGKTETGKALVNEFSRNGVTSIVLGQDNYFCLAPVANDAMRKKDPEWLGPHKEVNLKLLDETLVSAMNGANFIDMPHIDYNTNLETIEKVSIEGIKVIIVEGTYTSLLKHVDTKIFIDADYKDTLKFRKSRSRGNEVNDPFVENILETEHKIIAGHKFLADFVITKDYDVISVK